MDESLSSESVKQAFSKLDPAIDSVKNQTVFDVKLADENLRISTSETTDTPLVVGDGDWVIVHDHLDRDRVPCQELSVGMNVFVLRGGVQRFEFLERAKDIFTISNWISANFERYPELQEVLIASKPLSVRSISVSDGFSAPFMSADCVLSSEQLSGTKVIAWVKQENGTVSVGTMPLSVSEGMVENLEQDLSNLSGRIDSRIESL